MGNCATGCEDNSGGLVAGTELGSPNNMCMPEWTRGERDREWGSSEGVGHSGELSCEEVSKRAEYDGEFSCEIPFILLEFCAGSASGGARDCERVVGWKMRIKWVSSLTPKGSQSERKVDIAEELGTVLADPTAKTSSIRLIW